MRPDMANLHEIASAVMDSDRQSVVDWHQVAANDARTAEHPDTEHRHRGAFRSQEAKHLLDAVFCYDASNQLDLSTVDRLLIAAMIAARATGREFRIPYAPAEDEGPAGIIVDALAMLDCVERAECFDGATGGYFVQSDGREFRFTVDEPASEAEPATCQHCGEERGGGETGSLWKCGACNGLNGGEG